MVYSLLTMLTSHDRRESSQNFLTMSQDLESSQLMRQSGKSFENLMRFNF